MRSLRLYSSVLAVIALLVMPLFQSAAEAQGRRAVRRAAPPRAGGVVVRAYYRPLFISPYYNAFYDPWWYPYPLGWYGGGPYRYGYGYAYDDSASVRLQVTPRDTEVYVDGAYAGVADNFDGVFQRLRIGPGAHELTLYLAGHRTETRRIFLEPHGTFNLRHSMVPLGPGETAAPRPAALTPPSPAGRPRPPRLPQRRDDDGRAGAVRGDASFGAIAIRVQPDDAEVLIDGERWEGPRGAEALVVQVAPGTHRIEVRKDGYRSYSADIAVDAAQTSPVNISLPRQ